MTIKKYLHFSHFELLAIQVLLQIEYNVLKSQIIANVVRVHNTHCFRIVGVLPSVVRMNHLLLVIAAGS